MSYGLNKGIWGGPLDPDHPNRLTAAPKTLYLEGPWVFKRAFVKKAAQQR